MTPFLLGGKMAEEEAGSALATETEPEEVETDLAGAAPEEPETPPPASAAGEDLDDPESFRNFVEKVVGDAEGLSEKDIRGKLGDEYWQAKKAASETAKENQRLKTELEAVRQRSVAVPEERPAAAPKPAPAPTEQPDRITGPPELIARVNRIDARLASLQTEHKESAEAEPGKLAKLAELQSDIGYTRGRLEAASDFDKATWEAKLAAKENHFSTLRADIIQSRKERAQMVWEDGRERERRAELITFLQSEQARQKQATAEVDRFNEEFPKQFDAMVTYYADQLGFPEDPDLRQSMWEGVNESTIAELFRMQGRINDVDMDNLVQSKIQKWMASRGMAERANFGKASVAKRSAASLLRSPVRSGQRPRVASPKPTGTPKSYETGAPEGQDKMAIARARLNKVLPGL